MFYYATPGPSRAERGAARAGYRNGRSWPWADPNVPASPYRAGAACPYPPGPLAAAWRSGRRAGVRDAWMPSRSTRHPNRDIEKQERAALRRLPHKRSRQAVRRELQAGAFEVE